MKGFASSGAMAPVALAHRAPQTAKEMSQYHRSARFHSVSLVIVAQLNRVRDEATEKFGLVRGDHGCSASERFLEDLSEDGAELCVQPLFGLINE